MRLHPFTLACLLLVACFLSVTWIASIPAKDTAVQPDLQTLYRRLVAAELLGEQINRDVSRLLEEMSALYRAENISNSTSAVAPPKKTPCQNVSLGQQIFLQPNIFVYLPHLREHPDSIRPNVLLSQARRGVSIVLGIPTVKRAKQSYLINTLSSLLFNLTPAQRQDLLIIVFVAETDSDYVGRVAKAMRKNFLKEVQSGLIEVVCPSKYYYPNFSSLTNTFGDSNDRVRWRTKQNLDFSFLMLYAQDKGTYYVQLEDDIVAKEDYYEAMKTFITQQTSNHWFILEFSQLGFIGKMFQSRDLPLVAEFFLMFHKDKPIDWLLDHILWVKVCHPEKNQKHCSEQKAQLKRRYKPSLFQHVGLHSSLPGKLQQLKDMDFGKQTLFHAHRNPAANVSSSLKHYQQHSLHRAYHGQDFFWALTPVQRDYVLFSFTQPTHISRYFFRSGNIMISGDQFYDTTVEVRPSIQDKQFAEPAHDSTGTDDGFIIIGAFENGIAEGHIDPDLQPVSALRLVVQSDSDVWVLLSEIHIKV